MLSHQHQQVSIGQWLYQRFLEIAIYPSLWVAAGVASLTYFTQEALDLPPDWHATALIFAVALVPYNLDRLLDSLVSIAVEIANVKQVRVRASEKQ